MYNSSKSKINQMHPFIMRLKNVERRKTLILMTFSTILFLLINYNTKDKMNNGYQFFLSFLSIVLNLFSFIFFMLVIMAQEEKKTPNPFYLFRYVTYVFLLILLMAPFLYLWSMWDLILHLKW
jgi:hypothetical protein